MSISATWDGVRYVCTPVTEEEPSPWAFPVGEGEYPPERWYVAVWHDPTGRRNGGYRHTGIDINLDVSPRGDVERSLGLSAYSLADGIVHYVTPNWSGVPMIVVRHEHDGAPLWTRYAHIVPVVVEGERVRAGQRLGGFANWTGGDGGDHLHLDMALDEFEREWLAPGIRWMDPVPVLKAHLDPNRVDAMLARG